MKKITIFLLSLFVCANFATTQVSAGKGLKYYLEQIKKIRLFKNPSVCACEDSFLSTDENEYSCGVDVNNNAFHDSENKGLEQFLDDLAACNSK